ncbi:MAG: hypothetical protein BECKG1743D_GA0114223_105032 [Candidatus Kentron sp. G]|nr:MAG: hypothetical protein BECKG1743D_GA0114223_105032 [Candidatus Kentron sp. G]
MIHKLRKTRNTFIRLPWSAIRHPCLIMGQCPSNFEGRNTTRQRGNSLVARPRHGLR